MHTSSTLGTMATQINLHRKAEDVESFHRTTLITEQIEGRQLKGEKIDAVNPPDFTGFIISGSLAIAALTLFSFRLLHKREQSLTNEFVVYLDRVPCMNCHFFCINQHLKCAVNPSWVLTEKAINCLDYRPSKCKSFQ